MNFNETILKEPETLAWFDNDNSKNSGILFITKKGIGSESKEGVNILIQFLKSLVKSKCRPEYIIFSGKSIELVQETDDMTKILTTLEEYNSKIIFCKTSIEEYKLEFKKEYGKIVEIETIVELLFKSEKVVTI